MAKALVLGDDILSTPIEPPRAAQHDPQAAAPAPAAPSTSVRRQRQPVGRDHQFNVRLKRTTLDHIYSVANERNIPVAEVIEEAMEAMRQLWRG
jgi:hypothetical protein